MVSRVQMEACVRLSDEGLSGVGMPHSDDTPIPGVILYADDGHKRLEMVLPDGRAIDLLKVYRAAENCIRNWQKGSDMPQFVGDFKRLNPLVEALNGRRYALPEKPTPAVST